MRRYLENCRSIRLAVFLVISEFLNGHFSFEHDKAILIWAFVAMSSVLFVKYGAAKK